MRASLKCDHSVAESILSSSLAVADHADFELVFPSSSVSALVNPPPPQPPQQGGQTESLGRCLFFGRPNRRQSRKKILALKEDKTIH